MTTEPRIIELFAGPGGVSEGLRLLGLGSVGLEWGVDACATRAAAGHRTIRTDVANYPPERFAGRVEGLWASPPCPDWSQAGRRAGREGASGGLVDEVPRWVGIVRPRWVACEQVPPALHVWEHFAHLFRQDGYSTWTGLLSSERWGVPQTRERAILLARLDGAARPPTPTHQRYEPGVGQGEAVECQPSMFGPGVAPWVSMADALGWAEDVTVSSFHGAGMAERHGNRPPRHANERPATTVMGDPRLAAAGHHDRQMNDAVRLTIADALTLQGFRPDYPLQGTKTSQFQQVGNAVPPPLAAAIIAAIGGY